MFVSKRLSVIFGEFKTVVIGYFTIVDYKPNITLLPANKLKEKHGIKELYQLSSYSFKESGNITLTITENHTTNKKISIQVK